MNSTNTIDLKDFQTAGSRVFTGRDRVIEVRTASNIDSIESHNEEVFVKIPADIGSINPSFLEEFLLNVVIKLNPDNFFKKFHFINEGRYKITNDLQEAVDRILREETALSH